MYGFYQEERSEGMITILQGDVLEQLHTLPDKSVQCCVTSPPYYGLRNYGVEGQIGLEDTPEAFVEKIVEVFHEVKRVLRDDGTLWLNLGDSYAGSGRGPTGENGIGNQSQRQGFNGAPPSKMGGGLKPKDMIGIPWMVAVALRADGWYLRSDIIWSKPNPMPESVTDRPTKAHEYVFLLTKNARYFYDADAVREKGGDPIGTHRGGSLIKAAKGEIGDPFVSCQNHSGGIESLLSSGTRNRRTVWEIATQPTPDAHFATFPEALVEPCIKAGTSERGCCSKCGAPMERVSEKGETLNRTSENGQGNGELNKSGRFGDSQTKTTGWQPTCKCNADTVPCVVLDPFGGSGTTAKVARDLKRDCILIELNPKYIGIAREKLRLNEQLVNA
jgi:DNA modification methylase